jgi:transposase
MASNGGVLTEEQARTLLTQSPDAVVSLLVAMSRRIQALEEQLAKNSNNSSKPPSSDGLKKKPLQSMNAQSLRKKSGKKPGGQKGHLGSTLEAVETPDAIVVHAPDTCQSCRGTLERGITTAVSRRQVFEMPEPRVVVTEHQIVTLRCPCCGKETQATAPTGVEKPVQYGPNLLGFATYLHTVHLIPYARCAQILKETTGAPFSAGSLHQALRTAHSRLASFDQALQEALADVDCTPVKYVDETGTRVAGKLHWCKRACLAFHVRCTEQLCRLFRHEKRGGPATADLLSYSGTLVSDFWASYVALKECRHVFCGAHVLRELTFVHEVLGQGWARGVISVLEEAVSACHRARERGAKKVWNASRFASDYRFWIEQGLKTNSSVNSSPRKARCLAERLWEWRDDYLRFLYDLSLPFTNNLSEQAIRMFKVKSKISGGFRTTTGADWFCRIRSYVATCQRQGMGILECLRSVFAGQVAMPMLSPA